MADNQPAWHREVLPQGWARAADDLAARSALDGFHLSGGTGLALHLGHRRSVDFDLFCQNEFNPADLQNRLHGLQGLTIRQAARGTLHVTLHGILVSFLHYPYPLLFALGQFEMLTVADPRDLACTKVNAIATRGSRRDFVDLYFVGRQYGLSQIIAWSETKFASAPYNRMHLLKALTYFKDAEQEPLPDMLVPLDWAAVTGFFVAEVPRLLRETTPE